MLVHANLRFLVLMCAAVLRFVTPSHFFPQRSCHIRIRISKGSKNPSCIHTCKHQYSRTGGLSVRLRRVRTSIDQYPEAFKEGAETSAALRSQCQRHHRHYHHPHRAPSLHSFGSTWVGGWIAFRLDGCPTVLHGMRPLYGCQESWKVQLREWMISMSWSVVTVSSVMSATVCFRRSGRPERMRIAT